MKISFLFLSPPIIQTNPKSLNKQKKLQTYYPYDHISQQTSNIFMTLNVVFYKFYTAQKINQHASKLVPNFASIGWWKQNEDDN